MVVLPSERGSRGGARQPVMVGDRRGSKSGVRCCGVAARAIQTAQAHVPEMDAGEVWLLSRATCGGSRPAQAPACTAAVVCPRACTARSLGALLRPPAAPTPAPASLKRASRPRGMFGLVWAAPLFPLAQPRARPRSPSARSGGRAFLLALLVRRACCTVAAVLPHLPAVCPYECDVVENQLRHAVLPPLYLVDDGGQVHWLLDHLEVVGQPVERGVHRRVEVQRGVLVLAHAGDAAPRQLLPVVCVRRHRAARGGGGGRGAAVGRREMRHHSSPYAERGCLLLGCTHAQQTRAARGPGARARVNWKRPLRTDRTPLPLLCGRRVWRHEGEGAPT